MSESAIKTIRKFCKTFKLNPDIQKKVYKGLSWIEKTDYMKSLYFHMAEEHNRLVMESYK